MKIVNCTPHRLNILDDHENEVMVVEPSGQIARVNMGSEICGEVFGFTLSKVTIGDIEGLPPYEDDTIIITSSMVEAQTSRQDVYSPGALVRDESGKPIGCQGLKQTAPQNQGI